MKSMFTLKPVFFLCISITLFITTIVQADTAFLAAGDSCITAIPITEGTTTVDTLVGEGAMGSNATAAKWYAYTPAMDGYVNIDACFGGADTRLTVWTGDCSSLVQVAFNDDECDLGDGDEYASEVNFAVIGGTEYLINWDDRWEASGFDFTVAYSATPPDPTCDAPDILIQDNIEAYTSGDVAGQAPHWVAWPGGAVGGTVAEDPTDNTEQSILIDGVAGNQDALFLLGDATTDHYIVAWFMYVPAGKNAYFNLQHEMPTSTAGFWGLDVMFANGGTGTIDPYDGTIRDFTFDHDEWFEVYLIADIDSDEARLVIGTTTVAAWTFSNGVVPSNGLSAINFYPIDDTYSYYVDDINLWRIPDAGANQYCYTAMDIAPGMHTVADLECFGAMWDIGANFANSGAWYKYTPAEDGVISLASCNGGADTRAWIFEGECHDLKIVGVNDDQCDLGTGQEWASYREAVVTGGLTYYIMWDNPWDDIGFDFELTFTTDDPAPGHFCQSAIPVTPGEQNLLETYDGNAAVAGPNIGAFTSSSTPYSKSNWYQYTPPFDGTITLSSCDGAITDTRAYLYTGDCANFDVLNLAAIADDGCPTGTASLLEDFPVTGGTTYYIEWDNRLDDTEGAFLWILEYAVDGFEVTFNVDMSLETVAPDGAHIAGEMNGWSGQPMTDNGDGTWSISYTLPEGETIEFKYQNGLDGWENNFPDTDCGLNNNRFVVVGNMDMNIDLVCFNACVSCDMVDVDDLIFENAVSIYPNPVNKQLFVQMDFPEVVQNLQLQVFNTIGQQVIYKDLGNAFSQTIEIATQELPQGTYFLQLTNNHASTTKKFIVQ